MKGKNQKKGNYLLGLLVGVVALGIGYAAITNVSLSITGSATATGSATDADFTVRFVQTTDTENEVTAVATAATSPATYTVVTGENVEASASVTDETHATFNVEGMVEGDEVTFTYYIANLSNDLGADITPSITNEYSENFTVTVNPTTGSAFHLNDGQVQTVTVTVTCIAQNLLDTTGSFEISFDAAATE